ncbi:MAG: hypothetical protein GY820_40370 [Gammaproteobacteria bacterium]|nr:hypothetical protein [Gammaproteobacteria bacterium]
MFAVQHHSLLGDGATNRRRLELDRPIGLPTDLQSGLDFHQRLHHLPDVQLVLAGAPIPHSGPVFII